MPYMERGNLDEIIHNKNKNYDDIYTNEQITHWIDKICCGLSYLHEKKIIHRNINPSNVLLGKSYDDVQLSDFGIARSLSSIISGDPTTRCRTLLYTAPEMFNGAEYDFSVDIYSLSITIWEILNRRKPYESVDCSNMLEEYELFHSICSGERPELNNNLSKEVSDLLTICWDTDASKRPTIDHVRKFCRKTTFSLVNLKIFMLESATSFGDFTHREGLGFSKTITDTFEELHEKFGSDKARSKNIHNKIFFPSSTDLKTDESLSPMPSRHKNEIFPVPKPIEKNPDVSDSNALLEIVFEVKQDPSAPEPVKTSLDKQTILLVDGLCGTSLLMLENNGRNWKQLNIKPPFEISGHGAQFLNNSLYIFGGQIPNPTSLNSTYKLSKSFKWKKMANMNQKRRWISNSSVILNNQIWICGGNNGEYGLKSVEMYDPETNKWKYMNDMNDYRNAAVAVVNGKIFGSSSFSVECYDRSSDVWTFICSMPQVIAGHSAAEMNGNLIVMGGDSYEGQLKNVWALDTTNRTAKWIEKPSMSIQRSDFSVAKIGDKLFVCGGYLEEDDRREAIDLVEIFREVWENGPKMPSPRWLAPAVTISMEFAKYLK